MDTQKILRDHVLHLLRGGGAHLDFDSALSDLPHNHQGAQPKSLPHTPWRLLEHMRIAQWDILEFSRNPKHRSPPWPDGYWPDGLAPASQIAWDRSMQTFHEDNQAMQDLVADPSTDLVTPIPWGDGQTILREALLVADHNAYHLGQLVTVRRLLGAWQDGG